MLELYPCPVDSKQQVEQFFTLFLASPLQVKSLCFEAPNDEVCQLLTGETSVKEIRRWAGRHPYALQLIHRAVEIYREQREENSAIIVRNALGCQISGEPSGDTFEKLVNEFIRNIYAELEAEIILFREGAGKLGYSEACEKLGDAGLIDPGDNGLGCDVIELLTRLLQQPARAKNVNNNSCSRPSFGSGAHRSQPDHLEWSG